MPIILCITFLLGVILLAGSNPVNSEKQALSTSLASNINLIKNTFSKDATLKIRTLKTSSEPVIKYGLAFSDGMVNNKLINEDIIRPLYEYHPTKKDSDLLDIIAEQVILSDTVEKTGDMQQIIQAIIYGDCILLIDGFAEVLILNTKGWATRSISEPENEKVLKGPREGFTESLIMNLSLIRRRLRTPDLKMEYRTFGTVSQTQACVCYIEGIVNPEVLTELNKRLNQINIDGTLDVNYISEMIKDAPNFPIETVGSTERADIVAAKLLEGRVALFLDGTPAVLMVPHLFIEYFQSDEDYYTNYFFGSINRVLRLIAFIMSTCVPAFYITLVTFHQEIIPTALYMSISAARQGVPFPSVVEATLMLIVFEMLRETGSRMPGSMGTALSIVGALVIGQAAVQAKIVSAPMIIVVGITGISGLMIPRVKGLIIPLRFALLYISSVLGLYGFLFGLLAVLIHLVGIKSFGIPIISNFEPNTPQNNKDIFIRASWRHMITRPTLLSNNHIRNSSNGNDGSNNGNQSS